MIAITNLSYFLGDRALYEEASLHIKPKMKVGLIGLNGTGKSTLLRLINGEYQPDSGTISKSGDCTIGFLNQDLLSYQTDDSILSVAMQAFERQNELQAKIDEVLHQMEVDYKDELVDRLAVLQEEFEALDGYSIQSKAESILEGLGFSTEELQKPLRQFSGGWRMRVMLAKLLLQKPSLLMLDEPTNHLDLESITAFNDGMINFPGIVLMTTHDHQFMQTTCNRIIEITPKGIIDRLSTYDEYLDDERIKTLQEEMYA